MLVLSICTKVQYVYIGSWTTGRNQINSLTHGPYKRSCDLCYTDDHEEQGLPPCLPSCKGVHETNHKHHKRQSLVAARELLNIQSVRPRPGDRYIGPLCYAVIINLIPPRR